MCEGLAVAQSYTGEGRGMCEGYAVTQSHTQGK